MSRESSNNRSVIGVWIGMVVLVVLTFINLTVIDDANKQGKPQLAVSIATADTSEAGTSTVNLSAPTQQLPTAPLSSAELALIQELFDPLPSEATPTDYAISDAMVTLGQTLFFDPRLSSTRDVSCNSCHLLDRYGVDGEAASHGVGQQRTGRNAPTVLNAALHVAQFWDGRAATVEEQALGPLFSTKEMGMPDPTHVESVLDSIPDYQPLFAAAFPTQSDPVSVINAMQAIGAFERRLMTPAPFDRFLAGDATALNEAEQIGLKTFVDKGCVSCHVGTTVGARFYRKLGHLIPYPTDDPGRYNVTSNQDDLHVFKVASLRNVAQTGPYLHDGSIATLTETVKIMGRYQLGKELSEAEIESIVTFLGTLTGDVPVALATTPTLPPDGPGTAALFPMAQAASQ